MQVASSYENAVEIAVFSFFYMKTACGRPWMWKFFKAGSKMSSFKNAPLLKKKKDLFILSCSHF